jgi:hypothetical protein
MNMDINNRSILDKTQVKIEAIYPQCMISYTQCTALNIFMSQGPIGYSPSEECPLTMDLSKSNNEEHPGRCNRSKLKPYILNAQQ